MATTVKKHISSLSWVIITGLGFILFIIAAVILIIFSSNANNLNSQVYFFLLVFIALIASGFLFGTLKSHAKYSGHVSNGTLELGGPTVIFCLIIYFGLKLAPTVSSFSLKFIVFGSANKNELVNSGLLKALFNKPDSVKIENGVAAFTDLSTTLLGQKISVIPVVNGYYQQSQDVTIPADGHTPIELHLKKQADSLTVSGLVIDTHGQPISNVQIVIADGLYKTNSDQLGNFRLTLPIKDGAELPVRIYNKNKLRYNNSQVFSSKIPLTLQLH